MKEFGGYIKRVVDKGRISFIDLLMDGVVLKLVYSGQIPNIRVGDYILVNYVTSYFKGSEDNKLINILSIDRGVPMPLRVDSNLDTRLRNRPMELRLSPELQQNMIRYNQFIRITREFFHGHGFTEFQTPILTGSSETGAGLFEVRDGKKRQYYLAQSPQFFKDSIISSGFSKYYQIARAFRDEDLRKSRQLEFTQVDLEMITEDMEELISLGREYIEHLAYHFEKPLSIIRLDYSDCLRIYGHDLPDLRYESGQSAEGNYWLNPEINWMAEYIQSLIDNGINYIEHSNMIGVSLQDIQRASRIMKEFSNGPRDSLNLLILSNPPLVSDGELLGSPYNRIYYLGDRPHVIGFDFILEGVEICTGAIRGNNREDIYNLERHLTPQNYQILLDNIMNFTNLWDYATPSHGGFGFGAERLASILFSDMDIKTVIPYPRSKNRVLFDGSPTLLEGQVPSQS